MSNEFVTVGEISERLRISRAFVYRFIATGNLPSIRLGRSVRVAQQDLDAFIEKSAWKLDANRTEVAHIKISSHGKGYIHLET
jgi:excisionase family DNA binding protein